jgi:hypothetical protein
VVAAVSLRVLPREVLHVAPLILRVMVVVALAMLMVVIVVVWEPASVTAANPRPALIPMTWRAGASIIRRTVSAVFAT